MAWESLGTGFQDYVLAKVFTHLSSEDTTWCRLVSRQWRDASRAGVVSLRPKRLDAHHLEQSFPKLRKIDLTRVGDLTPSGLDSLPKLKSLTSLRVPLVTDVWLAKFFRLTQLQKLNLSSASLISDEGLYGICQVLTELTYLNLKKCMGLTNEGLVELACLTKLTYLNLSALPFLTAEGVKPLRELMSLAVLKLNDVPRMDDDGMEAVMKLSQLTALHFKHRHPESTPCTDVTLMGIAWSLRELKKLVLSSNRRFTLAALSELTSLAKLEELRFAHVLALPTGELFTLLGQISSLEVLSVDGCVELKPEGMSDLLAWTRLTSLSISSGQAVNTPHFLDAALEPFAQLPCLRELRLSGYASLTGHSLHTMTSLTSLTLIACADLCDRHFTGLSRLSHLKGLELSYCDGLSDSTLPSLAGLKNLETLTIANHLSLTGNQFAALSSLTLLTRISVRHCESIQDAGFVSLASLRTLRVIDFVGCKGVTDAGVQRLAHGKMEELRSLRVADCNVRFSSAELFRVHSSKFRTFDSRCKNPRLPHLLQS